MSAVCNDNETLCYERLSTPIGELLIAGDERGMHHVVFANAKHPPRANADWRQGGACLQEARRQLLAYFAGELRDFDLPLCPRGTEFQRRAWEALQRIPYGETRSYADQAVAIGSPQAVRAVGAANGRNPLPIVIPCHRVIGRDGSLTGFGGGIEIKRWLLALEAHHATPGALVLRA